MRRIIKRCPGCELKWIATTTLSSRNFGALYAGSTKIRFAVISFSRAWIDGSSNHETSKLP